ncbi:class I SAM-dependent DNA methyltransferase [Halobacillus salinus]|uniref:class I SAM-dependent DNA methyltransferase n=1 Tax=Halobacillus salinus TaxID=192814 RepID=UPI0009A56CFD|nr:class I SAM-dependent methyltransferase [Halobacillus salinus]
MGYHGPEAYDQKEFFQKFQARRNRPESPNNMMEGPAIMDMIGSAHKNRVLDLGSGDGRFGVDLLQNGGAYYTGIEGSLKMVEEARGVLKDLSASILHQTLEEWRPRETYDLVVSRMVLHYIDDLSPLVSKVYRSLESGGRFIFSVQHPVITASVKSAHETGKRSHWIVDDYFREGGRKEPWIGEEVVKYHRSIEKYVKLLREAGFLLEDLREAEPIEDYFQDPEEFNRRQRIPLFLLISCRKGE